MGVWIVVCLQSFPITEYVNLVISMSRAHLDEQGQSWHLVFVEADDEQAECLRIASGVLRVFRVYDREQICKIEEAWTRRN